MASKHLTHLTHEQQNFVRLSLAAVDEVRLVLGYVLHSQIPPEDLVKKIQANAILSSGPQKLKPEQRKLCCIPGPGVPDYKTFDITLLYKLIRNLCSSLQPSQGWGKEPRPTENNIGDDIERLRIFRNEIMIGNANSSSVLDGVFKSKWNELENIFKRIQGFLRTQGNTINLVERLESIKRTDFGWQDKHETPILTLEGGEQKTCGESACFVVRLGNREIPHDWLITWHRIKGNITEQLDTSAERYKGSSSQRLVIPKVSKEEEGEYRATVSREEKGAHIQIPSNTIYLTVTGGESLGSADEPSASEPGIVSILKEREREPPSVQGDEISNIHEDPLIMCLLLCSSYKLDINDHGWIPKYNAVAKKFGYTTITKSSDLSQLEKYKSLLDLSDSEITFSADAWRNTCFLKAAESYDFVEIFLNLGDKENIANYCRSPSYRKNKGEVCYCLSPNQILKFVERLGEDIFTHSAFQDQSVKEVAFQKVGIPMQIIMRGDESIQNFIQNLKRGKQKIYHASGMIIGCAGSGKTTLLKRLQGITVEEVKQTTLSTRGVDIFTDVFDVTNTLQVSKSDRAPRFRMTVDKPDHNDNQTSDKLQSDQLKDRGDMENKQTQDAISPQSSEPNDSDEVSEVDDSTTGLEARASSTHQQLTEVFSIIPVSQRLTKDDEFHLERKISMTDFAGQCAYYASHPIFLSPRAFFLLVLNMEKNLDDVVDKEVCCQKGSVYEKWTYGDYVEFWLKSVHQYSGGKAPVLLVATCCENTTDKERRDYFWNLRKALSTKDKSLLEHLTRDRNFSVSFDDETEIDKIKSSIVETVQNLDHWGQDLPQSWVLFETFLLDEKKKEKKILQRDEVMNFNKELNEDIQLSDDDIDFMLQFFHDIREILYFDQRDLKDAIILDIQWFSNAFKNIITDENHAKEDLYDYVTEWETFNKTGVLDGKLLDAIWSIHPDNYTSHKKEIMLYMEKLGLLAAFADGEEKWYIPSMNKNPFKKQELLSYPSSSILCFQFDALPVGLFHRLVALCIQVPFKILPCGSDEQCIYQTAAIFIHGDGHHHFVIGMSKSAIQLQAFVFSGNVDPTCCHQIRQKLESILDISSNTFQSNFGFSVGYKCKKSGFCDEEESKIIPKEEFTKSSFACPRCHLKKKHMIETCDIIKYWDKCVQLKRMLPEDTTDSERLKSKKRLIETKTNPHHGMVYPFAKEGPQKAVMTSCIKAKVSKSVGLIYLPGGGGTGFRVGTKYIMTCLHVIKDIVKDDCSIDCGNIQILFGMVDSRPTHIDQENLFHFEPTLYQHKEFDLAILELKPEFGKSFPPQLTLSTIMDLTLDVHLLGHPGGGDMKKDRVNVYEIQPNNDVDQFIVNLSHWSTSNLPGNIDYYKDLREPPRKILFNTTFDKGSSGGPGIVIHNYQPYVVLMISGGVPDCHYENVCLVQHDKRIEFGYAMEDIYKEMAQAADDIKRIAADIFPAVH